MYTRAKYHIYRLLRWSEKYTKTDMVYFVSSNAWINVGRGISLMGGMLLTVAFANLLSPETFGTYKYVLAAGGTIAAFSLNGLGAALLRAVAQGKKHVVPSVVRTAILWSLPASAVAAAMSGYYFLHDNHTLGYGFLFIALTNAVTNGWGLFKTILQATGEFRLYAIAGIPRTIIPIIVMIGIVFFTKNVVWVLLAYFAANTIGSWFMYQWNLRRLHIEGRSEDVAETVRFGTHMSVLGFFMLMSSQVDQLLLWHFAGPAQLAIYALALSPVLEAKTLLDNFLTIIFPKLATKEKNVAKATVPLRVKQLFVLALIGTILYIALIPLLFKLLFPKYLASILASQVLALMILFQPKGIIDTLITSHGEVKKRYRAILTSQAIEFALFCGMIPFFGLWGAVFATVLSEAASALTLYIIYRTI